MADILEVKWVHFWGVLFRLLLQKLGMKIEPFCDHGDVVYGSSPHLCKQGITRVRLPCATLQIILCFT